MRVFPDYEGRAIRLTGERLAHILEHPEMSDRTADIAEALARPERVNASRTDSSVRLYYRECRATSLGDKLLCVSW